MKPLGFELSDSQLRRAGLDYHEYASLQVHEDWPACRAHLAGRRVFAFTTKASRLHADVAFQPGDVLVFGPETRGLPAEVLAEFDTAQRLRLPMRPQNRSLNLSNAVAVAVYEAWRQNGFEGAV